MSAGGEKIALPVFFFFLLHLPPSPPHEREKKKKERRVKTGVSVWFTTCTCCLC